VIAHERRIEHPFIVYRNVADSLRGTVLRYDSTLDSVGG
jgi:hypothetical protein